MDKGDLFTVYLDGNAMTICVLGSYTEDSGVEMVILAVVGQENMVHVPIDDLNVLFAKAKYTN